MRFHRGLSIVVSAILATSVCGNAALGTDAPANSPEKTITITESQLRAMIAQEVQKQLHELASSQNKQAMERGMAMSVSMWQTAQSLLELYKIQHHDRGPRLADLQRNWEPLLAKTNEDGAVSPGGQFGPYMKAAPTNVFLNSSQITAAGEGNSSYGWTYDEKKGSLRLVIPSNLPWPHEKANQVEIFDVSIESERVAKERSAVSTLLTLRSQLELYKIQHHDAFPTMAQLRNWSVLLEKTDTNGEGGSKARFGPYLAAPPTNAVTGMSTISEHGHATAETGWTYDEKTGQLALAAPTGFSSSRLTADDVDRYASGGEASR